MYYIDEFYTITSLIYSFFSCSVVCNEFFQKPQQKLKLDTQVFLIVRFTCSVSILDTTAKFKWWSNIRCDSINSLIQNYSTVTEAFKDIVADGDSRSANARGLLITAIFICTLFILHKLMEPIKILSNQLKSEPFKIALLD